MALSATDWLVEAAKDVKMFRATPLNRVVRAKIPSTATGYSIGGVVLPLTGNLGLRKDPFYVRVIHAMDFAPGTQGLLHWAYNAGTRTLQAYRRAATASLTTILFLDELPNGGSIAGSVLYIEVHGR